MELIPLLYLLLMPFFIIGSVLLPLNWRIICARVVAVFNLLLLWNAIYRIRLLTGMIQLFRTLGLGENQSFQLSDWLNKPMIHFLGSIFLPFLFLVPSIRHSQWASLLMHFFVLSYFVLTSQDAVQIFVAIGYVVSLFAATFSSLWLLKKLPFQNIQSNA